MPPVLIAIIPIVASIAVAVLKVSAIVKALILIAAFVAVKLLTKKPKGNKISQGAELSTKISPAMPRTICLGQTAIGGSCHFAFTTTDNADKPNRYLYRVLQISDQPINALLAVNNGKVALTFAGDITTGWFSCNQHVSKTGAPCLWARVYKGVHSGAVADATLVSDSGGQWTSAHKGTGLSYAIVKYDYDPDAFPNGEPELVWVVQGAKVYDDRLDSTKPGGSGSQRLDTPTTWAYTDNTAILSAHYLRGFTINGKRIMGVGAEEADLYTPMLFSAFNTCDQSVAMVGGTEKRYACGTNIGSQDTAESHLQDFMLSMDGQIFDRGGMITIWPGAVRTPIRNITEQDIDWTAQKSWQPHAGYDSMINCVQGNFVDKDNFYQERDLPIRTNPTWEADDGNERFSTFLSLRNVNRWSQGQRIMGRVHQASRYNGIVSFVGGIWLLELEQGDWFTMTVSRWSLVAKYFEVREIVLTTDMRVAIIGREVSTALDDWAPASDEFAREDTYWNPNGYGLPIPTFSLTPYVYYQATSGVQQFGITFTLITPSGQSGTYIQYVEVQYAKVGETATPKAAGNVTLDLPRLTVLGLEPAPSEYLFRARCYDGTRFGDWSAWPSPGAATPTDPPDTTIVDTVGELGKLAADNIITKWGEKIKLKVRQLKLDTNYIVSTLRADIHAVPYTTVTTAKTNWNTLLASYSPAWDKENEDTYIYLTAVLPDNNFPTGWTLNNSLATSVVSGYTQLTDSSGASARSISRSFAQSGTKTYSGGILVQKDTTGKATRNPIIQLIATGGTAKTATVAFDTATGEWASDANTLLAEVIDMGTDWYVFITMTTNSNNTAVEFRIYPAGSTNLSLTLTNGTQGNIKAKTPALAQGDWKTLGGMMLVARESAFQLKLDALNQAISTRDNAWEDASSGIQIGGTPNLPPVIAAGTRFVFTGAITYTSTTTSATINVAAGDAISGNLTIPYNAMSIVKAGTAGTTVQYYLWILDPLYAGGTQTLQASATFQDTADDDGSIYIGYVTVVYPASGTGGGGGFGGEGSYCVDAGMLVYTARGWIPAKEVRVGDYMRVLDNAGDRLTWVLCEANGASMENCYRLSGEASDIEVTVSESTPISLMDGSLTTPDKVEGKLLPFVEGRDGEDRLWWEPVQIESLGLRPVRKILCGGRVYVAGKNRYAGIATHNPTYKQ